MNEEFFKSVVHEASELLNDHFLNAKKTFQLKENYADVVTESDKAIEEFIINKIKEKFKDHIIIAEESVNHPIELTDSPTWFIDPIDGTSNFASGFPFCCISVAFYEKKEPVMAAVYSPMNNSNFFAKSNQGAFLNGKKITVSKAKDIKDCLIFGDYGGERNPEKLQVKVNNLHQVIEKSRGIRIMGSAAMHCCYVACGRGDAFFEFGIHCWDYAAGVLIAKEAGAVCFSYGKNNVDLLARNVLVCSNKQLAEEIVNIITPIDYPRD